MAPMTPPESATVYVGMRMEEEKKRSLKYFKGKDFSRMCY